MAFIMKAFEHLKIHLEEIKKATNNFAENKVIGSGGFGKVYEGEVSHSKGRSMVAMKRLSREYGQGEAEFKKEIMMLSLFTHENLISLLGFCDEDGEKILVYEHACNGSLDRHLSLTTLTWTQRLKICLDVAKGIAYLHDHKGTQQRVLHRDIKSANILLDENWNAKLSDMGLSKITLANQRYTFLFTNVVGTYGYCDPQYMETCTLTKESDIYSFGVVLFEVLCGRLCYEKTNGQTEYLVAKWKQSYEGNTLTLGTFTFKDHMPPVDPKSLEIFSDIAFQCLQNSSEQRPTISLLVQRLEIALDLQKHQDVGCKQRGHAYWNCKNNTIKGFVGDSSMGDNWFHDKGKEITDTCKTDEEEYGFKMEGYDDFLKFMEIIQDIRVIMKRRDVFRQVFDKMIYWFHIIFLKLEINLEIPPKIQDLEICLLDLYLLIRGMGGSEEITRNERWDEVALSFGIPACLRNKFKAIAERYLDLPDASYKAIKRDCMIREHKEDMGMASAIDKIGQPEVFGVGSTRNRDGSEEGQEYDHGAGNYDSNSVLEDACDTGKEGLDEDEENKGCQVKTLFDDGENLVITLDEDESYGSDDGYGDYITIDSE